MTTEREHCTPTDLEEAAASSLHLEKHAGSGVYVGAAVLGGIDGIVTTFAVVSGVEGASLSSSIVLVLGLANLIADGFSMALGNYLGSKSESDYYHRERAREVWEVENLPEVEREEIREIYARKKFEGKLLDDIVNHITSDKELWVETMMREELDLSNENKSAALVGLSTFLAFLAFGFVPLIAYVFAAFSGLATDGLFAYCVCLTALALFLVGALKSRFTLRSWMACGLESLLIGGLAGSLSYVVGYLLRGLAH